MRAWTSGIGIRSMDVGGSLRIWRLDNRHCGETVAFKNGTVLLDE